MTNYIMHFLIESDNQYQDNLIEKLVILLQ